jgi:hypothetical protein
MHKATFSAGTFLCSILLASGMAHFAEQKVMGAVVAADSASNSSYAAESGGAWKGLYPTADENPPGMDNGGTSFNAWDFFGGFHQPQYSPYGRLNHFIAGVDFAPTSFNNLGSPAFALTNSNFYPPACGTICAFGGETARATRSFVSAMVPGDTLSINFDNPLILPEVAWYPAGFLIRLNTGHGPAVPNHPTTTATERFGIFAASGTYGGPGLFGDNWAVADAEGNTDAGVNVSTTTSGAELRFKLETNETYSMELKRLSDGALLFSRSGNLSAAGAGPIDTLEIVLFGNGSGNGLTGLSMQGTGEREFFFNNLQIDSASAFVAGDYNRNGVVDAADYALWRDTLGQSVTAGSGADGDNNGNIEPADYNIWRANFGSPSPAAGTGVAVVPEPPAASIALATVAILLPQLVTSRRTGVVVSKCTGNSC